MFPGKRATLKLVPGQVYNIKILFQHRTLMVEHDKRSEGGFFWSGASTDARRCFTTHWRPDCYTRLLGCSRFFSLIRQQHGRHEGVRRRDRTCLFNLNIHSVTRIQQIAQLLLRICFTVMCKMYKNCVKCPLSSECSSWYIRILALLISPNNECDLVISRFVCPPWPAAPLWIPLVHRCIGSM